jgi:hypothetical protein
MKVSVFQKLFANNWPIWVWLVVITGGTVGGVLWMDPGISKKESYMIVVSRPYWLSFYSKDTKKVAWVVVGAYESSCV